MEGTSEWCSTPSAVEALPCGSRSTTSTCRPCRARAAAMFTVVVVLPTPPFWFATVRTRVSSGVGSGSPTRPASTRSAVSAARAIGVSSATSRGSSSGSTVSVTASSFAVAVPLRSSGLAGVSAGARRAPPRFHVKHRRTLGGADRWTDRGTPPAAGRQRVPGTARGARPAAPSSSEPRGSGPVFHVKHRPEVAPPSHRSRKPRRPRRPRGPRLSRRPRLPHRQRPSHRQRQCHRPPARYRTLRRSAGRPATRDRSGCSRRQRREPGRRSEHRTVRWR